MKKMFVFHIIRHNSFIMEPFSEKIESVVNNEVTIRTTVRVVSYELYNLRRPTALFLVKRNVSLGGAYSTTHYI